jgi:DNA-binding winged helix-turn-helix (wHTH) protein
MRFHDLTFEPELLAARRDDGRTIRFTRKERALLERLVMRAPNLLTRTTLADALAQGNGTQTERNVDFVINRLRAKLGDSAREPRFIATQYGEGYYWVAKASAAGPLPGPVPEPQSGQFPGQLAPSLPGPTAVPVMLAVGPIHGVTAGGPCADVHTMLTAALQAASGPAAKVACAPALASAAMQEAALGAARYTLEASCHAEPAVAPSRLHLALVLRHRPTQQILDTYRVTLEVPAQANGVALQELAAGVLDAMWHHGALPRSAVATPTEPPLELRLHETALLLTDTLETWRENEARIEAARAARPDDRELDVMRALALYSRIVLRGAVEAGADREWPALEEEIEALALGALPSVQDHPLMVLSIARLLFFINRGHEVLAERLAQQTFEHSTAFAAAFATLAPMRMCAGRIDDAVALCDQGIALSEPGSEFRVSLLVLKCIALLAAGRRAQLDQACAELYRAKPITRLQLGLMVCEPAPAPLPPDLAGVLGAVDRSRAVQLLRYVHTVYARRFRAPAHRRNVLFGLNSQFERHFGAPLAPPEVMLALGADS